MSLKLTLILAFLLAVLPGCSQKKRVWIPGWKETSSIDIPMVGAAVVATGGTIYLIGGVDGKIFLDSTIYAKIQEDGSLGPWQSGTNLNEERGFIGAAVYKDSIYVVGGGNGTYGKNLLRSVERARILPDGSLGPWVREKSRMIIPRRCSKVAVVGNAIYSFGGFGGALLDTVERAEFMEDGSIGEWRIEKETMTIPRYINGMKNWNDTIYVVGGHDEMKGTGIKDVEWSDFKRKGNSKRTWKAASPLHVGRYGLATVAHDGHVYALGGITGTEYLDSSELSRVDARDGLSQWRLTTPLPQPRATFGAVVYKEWLYILGGTNRDGYLTDVSYATFNDEGDVGFWGTESEAKDYKAMLAKRKVTEINLSNEGVVQQVVHASAYSYIQVKSESGVSWIAGPKIELRPNMRIRYSKGVYMSNFYSKELQRDFPSILFVGSIQQAE